MNRSETPGADSDRHQDGQAILRRGAALPVTDALIVHDPGDERLSPRADPVTDALGWEITTQSRDLLSIPQASNAQRLQL